MTTATGSIFNLLKKHSNTKYNQKGVDRCLLLLKKSSTLTDRKREEINLELYCLVAPIIIKAINNFNNLVKGVSDGRVIHTEEDIAIECYLSLVSCVKGLKIEYYKSFHFYLNTSLNRMVFRLFEKNYKNINIIDDFSNINDKDSNSKDNLNDNYKNESRFVYHQNFDLMDLDIESLNLSDIQLEILKMKVEGQSFKLFLKKHKINRITYKEQFEILKEKIKSIYKIQED